MRYNQILQEGKKVLNHENAEAYALTNELELYTLVCTMALQPKFYESPIEQVQRVASLVAQCDHEFVAKLAIYARQEMYLRSVPLLLVVELAKVHSGDDLVSRTIEKVVMRADEIMELLMCYQWRNPQQGVKKLCKLSHQVQVGLQKAFNRFDEYQFAKYDRDNLNVKLRDALFIVHPKPKDEAQQAIFDKIVSGKLEIPYTWETELSALGQKEDCCDEDKRNKWAELINSGKLGYMALLRNLRNILDVQVDYDVLNTVIERISNPYEVAKAKQFPFRYFSAYKEIKGYEAKTESDLQTALIDLGLGEHKKDNSGNLMLSALENAVISSVSHIEGFNENTKVMIATDMSGSMCHPISAKSKIQYYEVGILMSMLLRNCCNKVVTGIFGDEWKVIDLPKDNILQNTDAIANRIGEVGYGTLGNKPLRWLIENKIVVDKVMYFTDMQFWEGTRCYNTILKCSYIDNTFANLWNEYKKISPQARLYLFDLAGYGYAPISIPREDVTLIAGWSDKIFTIMQSIENGSEALAKVQSIEL